MSLCWVRTFNATNYKKQRYVERFIEAVDVVGIMRSPGCKDVVCMETGHVIVRELKGKLPGWLFSDLARLVAVERGEIPVLSSEPEYMI